MCVLLTSILQSKEIKLITYCMFQSYLAKTPFKLLLNLSNASVNQKLTP